MKRQKLYLDTSVPSAYFDKEKPERQEMTREFWRKLKNYDVFISKMVARELKQVKVEKIKKDLLELVSNFEKLDLTKEARKLGNEYIKNGVIPRQFENDAFHIAITSVNEIDFLVSWNFKHLVNIKTRRLVNLINLHMGYKIIEIVSPPELQ